MGLGRHDFWIRQLFAAKIFPGKTESHKFSAIGFPSRWGKSLIEVRYGFCWTLWPYLMVITNILISEESQAKATALVH